MSRVSNITKLSCYLVLFVSCSCGKNYLVAKRKEIKQDIKKFEDDKAILLKKIDEDLGKLKSKLKDIDRSTNTGIQGGMQQAWAYVSGNNIDIKSLLVKIDVAESLLYGFVQKSPSTGCALLLSLQEWIKKDGISNILPGNMPYEINNIVNNLINNCRKLYKILEDEEDVRNKLVRTPLGRDE